MALSLLFVNRALALLALWAITEPAHAAAAAEPEETLAVLVMDDARMSQVRYLNLLLDRSNISTVDSEMDSCLSRMDTDDVTTCLRSDSSVNPTGELILVLNDAGSADRERPGLARLVCVGPGGAASDPHRQSITLWPRAYGLRSATHYIEDGRRLRACVAAAQAEAVP